MTMSVVMCSEPALVLYSFRVLNYLGKNPLKINALINVGY